MERNQTFVESFKAIGKNSADILVSLCKTFGIYKPLNKLLGWLDNLLSKK